MNRTLIFSLLAFLAGPAVCLQTGDPGKKTFEIGSIDYFGYEGLDLRQVEELLPIRVGDSVSFDSLDLTKRSIQHSIEEVTGKPATDITAVCCDSGHRLHIYIGLSGTSSRSFPLTPAPRGHARLSQTALNLYQRDVEAVQDAVSRGAALEDDSKGYSLSDDPIARRAQSDLRSYSASRATELANVLQNASDVRQRRASACLLGYANRSAEQIQSLTEATFDMDEEVRNNALRALSVLASAANAESLGVDPTPFIELLFSGRWTDRNKSSQLLMHLTQNRDPVLLSKLREQALAPLIEGALWNDPGHSDAFLYILGRIEGIDSDHLQRLIDSGDKTRIIQAAKSLVRLK